MLTLRRREQEPVGLQHWLTSADPIKQQFAAECLAEMGDTHGIDCLILLASTEDRKRRSNHFRKCAIAGAGHLTTFFASSCFSHVFMVNALAGAVSCRFVGQTTRASVLQQRAIEKLAEGRNPAAVGALVDALWRSEPALRNTAEQGLVKLLTCAGKDLSLSKRQWDLLLREINPSLLSRQKANVNTKLVIAVLKATVAADYLPAANRIKALSNFRQTLWTDSVIRSLALHCYSVLEQVGVAQRAVQSEGQQS